MVLSCAASNIVCPILFAGTCRQYSKNAIPQLIKIISQSAPDLNFKCPYQANVINILDNVSKIIGTKTLGIYLNPITNKKRKIPCLIISNTKKQIIGEISIKPPIGGIIFLNGAKKKSANFLMPKKGCIPQFTLGIQLNKMNSKSTIYIKLKICATNCTKLII